MSARLIPPQTLAAQRLASDPSRSAWVSAHAGSGKTHVLSRRVVRLLLSGAPPSRILCLTYTKAAAANMSARIFDGLAQWAMLDDDALSAAIVDCGAPAPSPVDLVFARRLFARAVETPGGLKIQTIHAFCERLLHLFPFEANAGAGFRVMDDFDRAELMEHARQRTLAHAIADTGALGAALARLCGETSERAFDELCHEATGFRETLADMAEPAAYARKLRQRLGLAEGDTLGRVEADIIEGGLSPTDWNGVAARLALGAKTDAGLGDTLLRALRFPDGEVRVETYLDVFFTQGRSPRAKAVTGGLAKKDPALLELMQDECARLEPLLEKRKAAAIAERSLALATLADALIGDYQRLKRARGLFDFDDLIERARELLRRSSPSWVLYKLDSAIDHILLDEAQDTSAAQWDILEAFANEFSAGESARRLPRSFFAVGDEKQSIYSFQGAAPKKFGEKRREFHKRFESAGAPFENVSLTLSFRSAPVILCAVDLVFAHGDHARGLSADDDPAPPLHVARKSDVAGLVEIWSPIAGAGAEAPPDWRLPLDARSQSDPAERMARKIARKIAAMLALGSGECVDADGALRPVEAGDFLVLVRKRDAFFEAMIRALKSEGVAVAGADRLELTQHIAVMDLAALGRAALAPQDDLSLAITLKSPLVGLDDDDLIALAPKRATSLAQALDASPDPRHRAAAGLLSGWRRDAAQLAPFDFYARLLGAGGRRKLLARLGPEANDAIDEFLRLAMSFEREQSASLTAFLATLDNLDISIKRDMEAAGGAVRVMTVHAAKGLEAKIVFLPDTCGAPAGRHDPKLFALGTEDDAALAWSPAMSADCAAVSQERARLREAEAHEHARLLYVALTRAEERLYIGAFHGVRGPAPGCWRDMIHSALEAHCEASTDPDDADGTVLRMGAVARLALARAPAPAAAVTLPAFATNPAPEEVLPRPPLRPSSALAGADAAPAADRTRAVDAETAQRLAVGRLTHALLQHLPGVAAERRRAAAALFLGARGAELSQSTRDAVLDAALAVIDNPLLAPLFGNNALAEVDIVAQLDNGLDIAGRIDRLAEHGDTVLIADFKTGQPRRTVGPEHLRQLALYRAAVQPLYPQKRIRCVLVSTQDASFLEPDDAALDAALALCLKRR